MADNNDNKFIEGVAAPLPIANLDTDQIMPKQFLKRIDKAGLAEGLLYDLRFDAQGRARPGCVLNQPAYAGTSLLIGAANFGCGSSREHAVWGLQQYGIKAVIAPSFGEIFYGNAMNNQLLLVVLDAADVQRFMADAADPDNNRIAIDIATMTVRSPRHQAGFTLSERQRRMFLEGLDVIGATLANRAEIDAYTAAHWQKRPWLKGVAQLTRERLGHTG
ncbi:MAG TPA: 3-isopropylmalate dehydratase small subunit [Janthinobacterium sp.]|nr:3-isopropylmalate dehydratase small subunit [Janthinobacterium sp.]